MLLSRLHAKNVFLTLNQRFLKIEYIESKTCCEKKIVFNRTQS